MSAPPFISAAPILSTPSTHVFSDPAPIMPRQKRSDAALAITYEISRTVTEIRAGRWRRIALQFPDEMLGDAPRVYELLRDALKARQRTASEAGNGLVAAGRLNGQEQNDGTVELVERTAGLEIVSEKASGERLTILADTSYGACCVDEIAAEHVDADVVVHYGRACLSPTARLPVIYVFTVQELDEAAVVAAFEEAYPGKEDTVVLMADVVFASHLAGVAAALQGRGYVNIYATEIVHNPSSLLPNRTVPDIVEQESDGLRKWHLYHISDPPAALLLTLSSRVSSIQIYPTVVSTMQHQPKPLLASTAIALRRRYALLTSLSTVSIFGILINTLSVKNYLHIVEHVKAQILAAGKKSYTFVVGKVNAAKIANFGEIGGWVVIGCWESSLVESKDFWKPVVTPFELKLALMGDGERIWTGEWRSDFQGILDESQEAEASKSGTGRGMDDGGNTIYDRRDGNTLDAETGAFDSDAESVPPEFNLRTGRYISHSRPLRIHEQKNHAEAEAIANGGSTTNRALTRRAKGDIAVIGGEVSPGAEFLRSKRTWKGLGSDFEIAYDESGQEPGTAIEEGRSGIAKGYTHGDHTTAT